MCASSKVNLLKSCENLAKVCTACELFKTRHNVVFGAGNPESDLMLIGEGPGQDEDLLGLPFVGKSGQLLDKLVFEELGRDRSQLYIANVVKCRPPNNRNPNEIEIKACRHFLEDQIEIIRPRVIVSLGNFATQLLLATKNGIKSVRGKVYDISPFKDSLVTVKLVPTFHPAAALRAGPSIIAQMRADLVRAKLCL